MQQPRLVLVLFFRYLCLSFLTPFPGWSCHRLLVPFVERLLAVCPFALERGRVLILPTNCEYTSWPERFGFWLWGAAGVSEEARGVAGSGGVGGPIERILVVCRSRGWCPGFCPLSVAVLPVQAAVEPPAI